jgi:hypothetical protein
MPGQVRYRTKPRQSSIILVRYRTVIIDAGMPMPALVSWMPMPSYVKYTYNFNYLDLKNVPTALEQTRWYWEPNLKGGRAGNCRSL